MFEDVAHVLYQTIKQYHFIALKNWTYGAVHNKEVSLYLQTTTKAVHYPDTG